MKKLFRIIEITAGVAERISSGTKNDHFHDFEEIIIISEGTLRHYIDFRAEEISGPFACYVPMGKMHRIEPFADLRGWVVNYKTEFVPDSELSFYSNFFTFKNISLIKGACLDRFLQLCMVMNYEYLSDFTDLTTLRHLLSGLISMISGQMKQNIPVDTEKRIPQIEAFNSFLKILETNFRRDEGVSFYAAKMNMSERNLNIICRNNFSKSVSEIIEARKLIEAKRLLLNTGKSISEIGFELGYNEKSYFTRVFKNRTGTTPGQYRELAQGIIS